MTVPAGVVAPVHDRKSTRVRAKLDLLAACAVVYETAVLSGKGANGEDVALLTAARAYGRELRQP